MCKFLEVIKLEGVGPTPEDTIMPREMFLLQVSNFPFIHFILLSSMMMMVLQGNACAN